MSYVRTPRRRRDLLGLDPATAYAAYKTGSTIVQQGSSLLQKLFGGNQDEKRQARVDYFAQAARRGSVLAARMVIAAPDNVAGNEDPMWIAARATIPGPVLAEALRQGPFWPVGAPFEAPDQIAQIERELASLEQSTSFVATTPANGSTSRAQVLPGMTTTAPFNFLPWAIGGALALLVLSRR